MIHCCILLDFSLWIVLWCTDPQTSSSVCVSFLTSLTHLTTDIIFCEKNHLWSLSFFNFFCYFLSQVEVFITRILFLSALNLCVTLQVRWSLTPLYIYFKGNRKTKNCAVKCSIHSQNVICCQCLCECNFVFLIFFIIICWNLQPQGAALVFTRLVPQLT